MLRCINCYLNVDRMLRHIVSSLQPSMQTLLTSWVLLQQIPPETVICHDCFLLLNQHCNNENMDAERELGHTNVCLGCGRSVLGKSKHVRHRTLEATDPIIVAVCSWNNMHFELTSSDAHVCHLCWMRAIRQLAQRGIREQRDNDEHAGTELQAHAPEQLHVPQQAIPCGDSKPAVVKKEVKVFCPKYKTKVLHNVEGMQKEESSKIIIANVYHYFEQEYEELTKTYEGVDLTPLSKFSERTALAAGVSESTVLEILQERARRNADVLQKPARKRPRQPESSSEEDSCGGDEDDGEHSTTEHVDEPEVYIELAGVKTEPDACGGDRELADPISVHVKTEPQNERDTTELTDPLSVHVNTEPQSDRDTTCCETVAALSAAKRHKASIKQRHAEAPPASCAAHSAQLLQRHAATSDDLRVRSTHMHEDGRSANIYIV